MKRPQGFDHTVEPRTSVPSTDHAGRPGPDVPEHEIPGPDVPEHEIPGPDVPEPDVHETAPPSTTDLAPSTDVARGTESLAPDGDGSDADAPGLPPTSLRKARRERRRFERSEVRRFTRRTRRRRLVWIIAIGSVVAIAVIAAVTAYSPLMAVRTIDVVGATRLQPAEVQKALSREIGTPLPLVNAATIKKELARFPVIRSYSIESHPPGTLIVRLVERTPIGLLKTTLGYDLVDQAGVVIAASAARPGGYPVIVLPAKQGTKAAKRGFAASAAVLASLPQAILPKVDSITAQTTDDVSLTLTSGTAVVWGAPEQSDLKAADLAALLQKVPRASSYDVSAPMSPVTG